MVQCLSPRDPNAQFFYCPSLAAAILFSVLFGLTTLAHIAQAIVYRKTFCWVIVMAGLWETAGLVVRVVSVENPASGRFSEPSQILILLAPLWINAFDYMLLGRIMHFFIPGQKVWGISARRLALCFVILDMISFLVQATGAVITTGTDTKAILLGIHIYMGGIGLQECFILSFLALAVKFHHTVIKSEYPTRDTDWRQALYTLYGSLALITIRIIYRLIEWSQGIYSTVTMHEAFFYCLDALPMFCALILFNILHPGAILVGPDSEFPKRQKKNNKRSGSSGSSEDELQKQTDSTVTVMEHQQTFEEQV